jgi:hypothetical protein
MKKLIGSALVIASALAATPLLAHPGERGAGCDQSSATCPQGAGPRGPQAMGGGMGRGMGQGMRQQMAMNAMQDCPMMKQGAATPGKTEEEHKH